MPSITIKEYFSREGSIFSNKDARVIGPVLDELAQQGALTARDVLDAARSPQSPLHSYFEWNDKVAADQFRIDQARVMLRAIKVKFIENGVPQEARAFQIQRTPDLPRDAPRTYRTFQVLHGDSAFAAQMMDSAFDDLMRWRSKYSPYCGMWQNFGDAFQAVLNQISEFEEEFAVEQAAVETDDALLALLKWREESAAVLSTWTAAREQIEFIMQAIGEAETLFAKLNEKKHRDCIKCGKSFLSVSVGNRMCPRCLNSKTVNEKNVNMIDARMASNE